MDITGFVTLVGAVALIATISIMTLGSFTLVTAISTKAFEKHRVEDVIGRNDDGTLETRSRDSYTFKGRNSDRLRSWILAFPVRVLIGYSASWLVLSAIPIMVFSFDAQIVFREGKTLLEFGTELPIWTGILVDLDVSGWVLAWLTAYCLGVVLFAALIKRVYTAALADQELLMEMQSQYHA